MGELLSPIFFTSCPSQLRDTFLWSHQFDSHKSLGVAHRHSHTPLKLVLIGTQISRFFVNFYLECLVSRYRKRFIRVKGLPFALVR